MGFFFFEVVSGSTTHHGFLAKPLQDKDGSRTAFARAILFKTYVGADMTPTNSHARNITVPARGR
jgi:hypothetical protein